MPWVVCVALVALFFAGFAAEALAKREAERGFPLNHGWWKLTAIAVWVIIGLLGISGNISILFWFFRG